MLHNYKKELEKIQNEIVSVTNLAIVMLDFKGNYITKKENYSEFCSIFRKDKKLNSLCEECDIKAFKKTVGGSEPYIYRCHSGLIDIVVPLVHNGDYIGAILVGQALLDESSKFDIASIIDENLGKNLNNNRIEAAYEKLPRYNYEKIKNIANLVYYTGRFIIENIDRKKWHTPKMESNVKSINLSESPIEPAITYIKNNFDKNITLEEVALLCNMSVSHFSKIFKKEVEKTFKNYLNTKRMEKAKHLLEETNNTISSIAYSLGFEDTSYFTKIFKKYIGVTPKKYRELMIKKNISIY